MSRIMGFLELPANPAELAKKQAENAGYASFPVDAADEMVLTELEHGAEMLGFTDQSYFVEAGRSMILPVSFERDQPVSYLNFYGLSFEGLFVTFAKVHIGRLVGQESVRALCLTFTDVTLLPYFDDIPADSLLYVPALAVDTIEQTG